MSHAHNHHDSTRTAPTEPSMHEGHSGHTGHADHVGQFRRLFWIMLVIAVPVVAFSHMFSMLLGYQLPDSIVCLCLSVSDFDRYSLTIARWLTTSTTRRSPAEIYTTPRDVTYQEQVKLAAPPAATGLGAGMWIAASVAALVLAIAIPAAGWIIALLGIGVVVYFEISKRRKPPTSAHKMPSTGYEGQ